MHLVWLGVRVLSLFLLQFFLLVGKTGACDEAHGDGGTDDAEHTKRISTGVARCDLRHGAVGGGVPYRLEGFVGSTKTRGVGYGTIERANHHGKVRLAVGVEEDVIACKHHGDVKHNGCCREQVERYATFLETLEETRAHLQTYAEHEQDKSEVLNEAQNVDRSCETDVSSYNSREKNEGHSKGDTANLYLS